MELFFIIILAYLICTLYLESYRIKAEMIANIVDSLSRNLKDCNDEEAQEMAKEILKELDKLKK